MNDHKVYTHKLIHKTTVKETSECSSMVAEAQAIWVEPEVART